MLCLVTDSPQVLLVRTQEALLSSSSGIRVQLAPFLFGEPWMLVVPVAVHLKPVTPAMELTPCLIFVQQQTYI